MTSGNDQCYEDNLSKVRRQSKAVREGLSAEVTFEQRWQEVKELVVWISVGSMFQAWNQAGTKPGTRVDGAQWPWWVMNGRSRRQIAKGLMVQSKDSALHFAGA